MKRHLLHPGTVLGLVALVVALSGSVYAATSVPRASITSTQIKNGSVALRDLSPAARRALRGATGPAGPKGATGTTGSTGAQGAPGSARAFGFVSSSGVVDAARSAGITVTRVPSVGVGAYCVIPAAATGIAPAGATVLVSADYSDGAGSWHLAQQATGGAAGCAPSTGWLVLTDNFVSPAFVRADIGFSILIP